MKKLTSALLCTLLLVASTRMLPAADTTQPQVKTGKFRGDYIDSRFTSDGKHGVLITKQAVYESNGNIAQWKSRFSLIDMNVKFLAGNGAKTIFLVASDNQTAKDRTLQLCTLVIVPNLEFKTIRRIPFQAWDFASDSLGAIATGPSIEFTRDGGKTWTKLALTDHQNPKPENITYIHWISPNHLVANDGHYLTLLEFPAEGNPKPMWSIPWEVEEASVALVGNRVWAGDTRLLSLDLSSGEKKRTYGTSIQGVKGIAIQNQSMWLWSDEGVAFCTIGDDKVTETQLTELPAGNVLPSGDSAVMIILDGRFFQLSAKAVPPKAISLEVDNAFIDQELKRVKDFADANKPTADELRTLGKWSQTAGEEGQRAVNRLLPDQSFVTPRARILWITKELQRYCADHPATQPNP